MLEFLQATMVSPETGTQRKVDHHAFLRKLLPRVVASESLLTSRSMVSMLTVIETLRHDVVLVCQQRSSRVGDPCLDGATSDCVLKSGVLNLRFLQKGSM